MNLREVRSINPISIVRSQELLDANRAIQSSSKVRTGALRPGTSVSVLGKDDIASTLITFVPDRPSLAVDSIGEGSRLENDTGILAPWAAEVVGSGRDGVTVSGFDGGRVDDVVVDGVLGFTAAGGDVAGVGVEELDVDTVEPGGRVLTEDEVTVGFMISLGAANLGTSGFKGVTHVAPWIKLPA